MTNRNYGIDLLRIVSMMMVATLHVLGHGGLLRTVEPGSFHYAAMWALELAAYCAVNSYALISGFVGIKSKFKYSNIIPLCLTVSFYMLAVCAGFAVLRPGSVTWKNVVLCFVPFRSGMYWYFVAYFCVFFFMPFMNHLINTLDQRAAKTLVLTMLVVFSVLPTVLLKDMFSTKDGYSPLWIGVLYLTGAYLGKYGIGNHGKKFWAGIYLGSVLISVAGKLILERLSGVIPFIPSYATALVNYCSPFMVLAGVALLMLFSQLQLHKGAERLIAFFAPLSFSVYLIHENAMIREASIQGRFAQFASVHPVLLVLLVTGSAIAIWLGCSLVDAIRQKLFAVLRIKQRCNQLEQWLVNKKAFSK